MNSSSIGTGKDVLRKEAEAILQVMDRLGTNFDEAVRLIDCCKSRVVFTGMGKSGLVCKKMASTLSSVGVPAIFLHPADSLHGDLGVLQKGDILCVVSNSGETDEIIKILPWVKRMDIATVVITGNIDSTIARQGEVVIDIKVDEACPYNIVPTSSTTAAVALGDAIAIALMEKRKFRIDDFAVLHPGGALGKKLFLKVGNLMHTGDAFPKIYEDVLMKEAILEITSKRLGVTGVFNDKNELTGVITDGDLRRALEKYDNVLQKRARDIMTVGPKTIMQDVLAVNALKMMEEFSITSVFVVENDGDNIPIGVIHIHDLLRAKIV